MAYKELQTAAVRFVHVPHVTDGDVSRLQETFGLPERELEAVLCGSVRPGIQQFEQGVFAHLAWPVFNITNNKFESAVLSLAMGRDFVVILNDGNHVAMREFLANLQEGTASTLYQDSPSLLVYELLSNIMKQLRQEVSPSVHTPALGRSLERMVEELQQLTKTLEIAKLITTPEEHDAFRLLAHQVKRILGQEHITLADVPAATLVGAPASPQKLMRQYAWASAMMFLLVLFALGKGVGQ